jgi:hypothetical protein
MKTVLTCTSSATSTDSYSLAIKQLFYVAQSNRSDAIWNIPDDFQNFVHENLQFCNIHTKHKHTQFI